MTDDQFITALKEPASAQAGKLTAILSANARSEYGRRFNFGRIRHADDFRTHVPVCSYEDLIPEIERIRGGEQGVLTEEEVVRLHLSSGTSSASKLIPFTRGLQREFQDSIGVWLRNLHTMFPKAMSRPAYWVVTGAAPPAPTIGEVPIAFDADAAYLPAEQQGWFVQAQCVPPQLASVTDRADFFRITASFLLAEERLGSLSLWNPSFWLGLSTYISANFPDLLRDFRTGLKALTECGAPYGIIVPESMRNAASLRAKSLSDAGGTLLTWQQIWPALSFISCWNDAWARPFTSPLREAFPGATLQGKGLLATEAIVSIPFILGDKAVDESPVLLPSAHFFELRCTENGAFCLAHEAEFGREYEVFVTTSGGLYRYALGDRVRVTGFCYGTPRIIFTGKQTAVSDICGEKLHEDHVRRIFDQLFPPLRIEHAFAFLAPNVRAAVPRYTLFLSAEIPDGVAKDLASALDTALEENYNYAVCRRNGQLERPDVKIINREAEITYGRYRAQRSRLSTVKNRCLDTESGWEDRLT